jgi:hypothetical protein
MSDPKPNSKDPINEPTVVYLAAGELPDHEVSHDEALRTASYTAHHYMEGKFDHAVIVQNGLPILVIYHGHVWPDTKLTDRHIEQYEGVPFEVHTPIAYRDDTQYQTVYEVHGTGILRGKAEHLLDRRGELLSETRMIADDQPLIGSSIPTMKLGN